MTAQHLIASDRQIASLTYTARTRSDGDHPGLGSYIADALDALAAFAWDGNISHADALLEAATALQTRATDADEYRDPSDDRYDTRKEDQVA